MGEAQTNITEMVVKLFIKDPRGEITEIELCDSEFEIYTVQQLKTKIREKTARDGSQELIFKWCLLKDAAKLSDYGIQHESTIHLGTQPVSKTLFIKDDRGETNTFCLDEDEFKSCLVEHLKRRVQETLGIPEDQRGLVYTSRQLVDHRNLDYNGNSHGLCNQLARCFRGGWQDPEEGAGGTEDQQLLSYANKELEDGRTLSECGIGHESTIHLCNRQKNPIKIMGAAQTDTTEMVVKLFITRQTETTLTIELRDSEFQSCTVLQLKTKIREKEGIAEDRQQLIYLGKQLEDGHTLSDYGIQDLETIYLDERLWGDVIKYYTLIPGAAN